MEPALIAILLVLAAVLAFIAWKLWSERAPPPAPPAVAAPPPAPDTNIIVRDYPPVYPYDWWEPDWVYSYPVRSGGWRYPRYSRPVHHGGRIGGHGGRGGRRHFVGKKEDFSAVRLSETDNCFPEPLYDSDLPLGEIKASYPHPPPPQNSLVFSSLPGDQPSSDPRFVMGPRGRPAGKETDYAPAQHAGGVSLGAFTTANFAA